jgi:hypothetical protein
MRINGYNLAVDPVRNPFNPGAGTSPPLLVGRDAQLDAMSIAVKRHDLGRFERSLLLTGMRGVGKTVLLMEFGAIAEAEGWVHTHIEATEDIDLATALAVVARKVLLAWSVKARARARARIALSALRGFVKVHAPGDVNTTLTIEFDPLAGRADSGQLDADLADLFQELGDTARTLGSGMLITLDEIQYLTRRQLSALIVGLHHVSQRGLPVMVAAAGLPSMPGLAGEARSYAERLFTYVDIGSLTASDARRALVEPVEAEGASWSPNALKQALSDTDGYPYFLQEFGKHAWNVADGPAIAVADMRSATMLATDALDVGFFRARIDKTTDSEREYLRAMASLGGPGPYKSGDVSRAMGRNTAQTGPVRDSLIKRGLCYAPRHGELAFTVPMFDSFLRRKL